MAQNAPSGPRRPKSSPASSDSSGSPAIRRRTGIRSPRLHALATVLLAAVLGLGLIRQASTWAQDSGTPAGSPVASPTVTITPEPNAPRLVLPFEVLNDSGLSGTATLYEAGNKTIVDLDVRNTGDDQPAHIHSGRCGTLEPSPAFDLAPLHADGVSRTVIDTPLEGLLNGQFAIDIHLSPTELGTLSACANIEGTPTVPNGTATAASGTPGVSPVPTGEGGVSTTPTVTTAATTPASAVTPTTAVTPTATATATTTTGTTGTTGSTGDGTGGSSTASGATNTTTGSTTTTTTTTTTSTTAGDGTGTGGQTSNGSTYLASDGTVQTASMAVSGIGPLGIIPEGTDPAIIWSIVSAAILLFSAGIWIWIGERRSSHRLPPRWSRLGM